MARESRWYWCLTVLLAAYFDGMGYFPLLEGLIVMVAIAAVTWRTDWYPLMTIVRMVVEIGLEIE